MSQHSTRRPSTTQRRQKFLQHFWNLFSGSQLRTRIRSQRLGRLETLEERRVLATMFAVDDGNNLATFDSATPGTIASNVAITGLNAGELVVGIDTRPATGQLYALGLVDDGATRTGRIYTINPTTGVATQVGASPWSTTLADVQFTGFNFNPNVDRIRVTNRLGGNFRVHPDTGALVSVDTNLSLNGINGVSYTNNDGTLPTTTLYGMNFDTDEFATIGGLNGSPSPNGGVVTTFGATGIVALDSYALEITNLGGTTSALVTANGDLYTANLSTGALTLVGAIGAGTSQFLGLTAALNTIAVAGSGADDTLVVNATGPNSGSYSINGGPAVPFANIVSFSFIGGTGNDTLTINNPAGGLFAPTRGIDYQGGGQPGDTLNLLGGGSVAFNETYFVGTTTPPIGAGAGNNGDGLLRFTGPTPVDIRFTGLAPIIDTVTVGTLTINATDAANVINVTNGAVAPRVRVAVDAFESIEFNNKSTVTINANDGTGVGDAADTVTVNHSNAPAGLTTMNINLQEGDNTVTVLAVAGTHTLTLAGGPNNDLLDASATVASPVSIRFIAGEGDDTLIGSGGDDTFDGGGGNDTFVGNGGTDNIGGGVPVSTGDVILVPGTPGADTLTLAVSAGNLLATVNGVTTTYRNFVGGPIATSGIDQVLVDSDAGSDTITVSGTDAAFPTNIVTDAGSDSIALGDGVSLNGGTIDGGADIDTIDYSAYTTGVQVNLGLQNNLTASMDGGQENPAVTTAATGTATVTYNALSRQATVAMTVNNLFNPISDSHIHLAPIGVNGPVIVPIGAGVFVPTGTPGQFTANFVSNIPAANEAAFLGGLTYFNIHTNPGFPGGEIRGQIQPATNVSIGTGTATGTAGISNIENATGGAGNDSLVGNLVANTLNGLGGNDVLVGGPATDTFLGGANNDTMAWNPGDGSDVMDGQADLDTVQLNGGNASEIFAINPNGTRVSFARTSPGPFNLDVGTTEVLRLNANGGDDTVTLGNLAGVADLTTVSLFGQDGNDAFNVSAFPGVGVTANIVGGTHTTADTLNLNAGGPLTNNGTSFVRAGAGTVNYRQIESLGLTNPGNLTVLGTAANDNLVVNAINADSGTYSLNGGLAVAFLGVTNFRFDALGGSDTLTINNPAAGLFAPTGGIDYNGGGQAGDALNLIGGGAADLVQTYFVGTTTPPIGVGPGNSGDGLVRFTGSSNVDIRFTGLAPIVDTVLAASLTVNSTDAANNISITNGVAPRLVVAVDAFEPIEFNNKAQLIVNSGDGIAGGDAADTVLLNFSNLPAGLTSITVNADEGADAVNLQGSSNVPVTLNGGDGLDIINVGNNGALGAPGLLTPIAGPVTVNGGAGGANLTVDDTGAAFAANYTLSATTLTRTLPAGFGGVTYANLSNLLLATGSGPNIVTVTGTSVPTIADANADTDTLILAPASGITVYEQAGNYAFEFGTPGGLTAIDFENINLLPGNGVLNIVGDEGQGTNVGGAGVNDADLVEVYGTAQNAGALRLNTIALPQVVTFAGVTNLNVTTFDLDDDVVIDPFASTTQSWNLVANVNTGTGDDDVVYGNANVVPVADPVPNGSVAGVSENITVTPTLTPGAGEIAVPGVVTIHFQETEDLSFLLSNGDAGDSDTLTIRGTDSNLSDVFTIRPDAAGIDGDPVVDLDISAVQILQIENIAAVAPGGAQFFVTALNFEGLGGSDTFNLLPSASGTILNIDGGNPTNNPLASDIIEILATSNVADQFTVTAGATADAGAIASTINGTVRAAVSFTNLEGITLNMGEGAAADALTMQGTGANNAFTVVATGISSGTARVDAGPLVTFNGLGSAGTDLSLVGLGGDDQFSVTHLADWLVDDVNIDGGAPTASDAFQLSGTGGIDGFVYTANSANSGQIDLTSGGATTNYILTGVESALVAGLAAIDTLSVATANAVIVPGANPGEGTVKPTDNVGAPLLPLAYRSIETVSVTGSTAVIQGTEENDTITVSAAGIVTVTNNLGFNSSVNVSGFNSIVINSLGGDDTITISPSALFAGGIRVIGGANGNGSDSLSLSGADPVIDLEANSISGVVGGPVSFTGIEHLNVTAVATIVVNGKASADQLSVTPTGANTATIVPSAGGLLSINTNNPGSLTINTITGSDVVTVNGTSSNDTIGVARTAVAQVTVGALKVVQVSNSESLRIASGDGNDTINVTGTGSTALLVVDGGLNTANDTLTVTNLTAGTSTYTPGSSSDSGTIGTPDGGIQLLGTELITLTGAAATDTLTANGTHGNDTIALQFLGGANRIWLNGQSVISLSSYGTVNLNGRFGDDKLNVLPIGLVGVTTVNVNGGDPTASDELVVSGSVGNNAINYNVSDTVGAGAVAIAGAPIVNFATTEALFIDGQGGTDALTVTSPSGHRTTVTPGSAADSGTIGSQAFGAGTASVPLSYAHIGALATVTIAGASDIVEFNGTANSDVFNVTGTTVQILNSTAGFVTNQFNLTSVFALELRGLDGDDVFNVSGTLAAYGNGVIADGGNPSASDVLNLSGATGAVNVNLADSSLSTYTAITGYGSPVSLIGIETANVNAGNNIASVVGTSQPDQLTYTATGPNAASVALAGLNTAFNFRNAVSPLSVDGASGIDSVTVNGTSGIDSIGVVKAASTTVTVNALLAASFVAASTETLNVNAGDGNDTINVSGTTASGQIINILGGSPTSNALGSSDILNITMSTAGTTAAAPGATPDAGLITSPDGTTGYSGIESFNLTGLAAGANTINVQGTHDNDTIALQLINGNRVWINDRAVYTFANYPTVNINGLFGDDKINILPIGLVGVTTINVAGGDPTASDELVVSGSAGNDTINYNVSNTVGAGSVAITGAPLVNFVTTESLHIEGLGGTDALTVTSPTGHRKTVTPGAAADSGSIASQGFGAGTASVPLSYSHIGALGTVTIVGVGDIVEFNGTANSDTFTVSGTAAQISNATSGFVTNLFSLTNIFSLELRGLDGDDTFNLTGTLAPYTGGVVVDGSNPSASDVLTLNAPTGAVAVNLGATSTTTTVIGYGAVVTMIGVETLNARVGNSDLSVNGTSGDDSLEVTPTGANSATFRLTKSSPAVGSNPVVNGSLIGTLSVDLQGGSDVLTVNGTTAGEAITVTTGLVTVGTHETVNFAGVEALSVYAHQGADTITVTPGGIPIFIDGGDPIGVLPGDQLIVNAAVGFFAGPESDEGGVLTGGSPVSFDHIESLTVAAIAGCPFLILGTNADDDITVIARDASTTAGADGVQDFSFSINQGPSVVVLNQADLYIDAMAGDDDIVIRASAPNEAPWDVNVRVAGGSPSIGAPAEADRLVLETPNNAGGFDDVVFNPTSADTGNMVIDENANGVYDAGGTDSIITFGSFIFNCPPAAFTYTSTAGGVELIQYNGEGAPAVDDNLTINGTALDDTTILNPAGIGTGSFASGASPQFLFKSFDSVTVNSGTGGFDRVQVDGTEGPDAVTSNATTVTLGGLVTIGTGIDQLDINTFGGNDNVDLDLAVPGLAKFINVGGGNDIVNLLGVAVDPADPTVYGGDGDDFIIGSPNPDSIFGGTGNDILIGAGGVDQIYGEEGNDILGNPSAVANGVADDAGNDFFHGGAGSDLFIWEPGDGSDIIEGGAGDADALAFFGGAGAEVFNVFAKVSDPARAILFRNTGNITIDMAGIDQINVQGNAGADAYVVGRANNGDSGSVAAPTSPYTDPTASLSDLSTTEVRVVNIVEAADAPGNVFVDGRPTDDNLTVTVESALTGVLRVAGLPYDVRISGTTTADRLTIRGNEGNDSIKAINSSNATVEGLIGITFAGGAGHDTLSADAILIGGNGDDFLEGGAGADQLFGNDGEDTMVGGAGNDTFDGGAGFDSILVRGTLGNDAIDISQTADVTLVETVNGVAETDTLVLNAGTRTVERVLVEASAGNDTIRVQWADSLGTDANVNSLRVDVNGGPGTTADRLGVVDLGTGDLILFEEGTTADSGAMAVGPGNAEPLIVNFTNIERAQPVAGVGGDVVFFKHDAFEYNDARTLATYLGSGDAINVDPNINPGLDPIFSLPGDEDWFRVVAERTGVLDFQVYFRQVGPVASGRPGLPNSGNLDIAVTDAAGNVIAGFGVNDATSDERVRIPAVAGQTYYLRVFANGAAINTYNVTVDNYAPPTPRDMELLDNPVGDPPPANSDTGRSQLDNITRDNTPTLVFRLDDGILLNDVQGNSPAGNNPPNGVVIPIPFQAAAGAAGYRIAIFDEGSSPAPGTQVGTAPQVPLGFATFVSPGVYQFTTPVLADGTHFLTARVQMVDPSTLQQTGFGERSVALEILVDTVIPPGFFGQVSLADTTQGLDAASDSGVVGYSATFVDRVTNDTTPTFYGRAEANTIVRVYAETNGVAGLQSSGAGADLFLGLTVAEALDGTNQFPGGQWSFTTPLDLNNPSLGFAQDGARSLYMTAEDVAGNVTTDAAADRLNIFLDTAGAQVTDVQITGSPLFNLFGLKPDNSIEGPTPRVDSLTIRVQDFPNRSNLDPNFLYAALQQAVATTPGNFVLKGDHSGFIAIQSITFIGDPTANGAIATGSILLNFFAPLPDDRYTLTIKENVVDPVGNKLDGESNAAEPIGNPSFASGDGQPGGDFVARFTVDSRPEIGSISEGLIYVDINGNMVWDPEGQDNDATNRDFTFQFGQLVDAHFSGNFAPAGAAAASGYDKLGAYGKFAGKYSFILDTNDDGVGDFSSLMPAAYQVNGMPVAGDFNAAHPGDEIGLFDGSFWYLDTNGNNQIDLGERFASNFNGLPVVGDFNGDGNDDLAVFVNDTNRFVFDTNRDGNADFTWNVSDQLGRFGGLSGFTDRPVAGDLNLDGIDDIGLWAKDRQGTLPRNSGEYFFWVSDRVNANPANVFNSFSPAPIGNDLSAQFGDELALPVFGNFDPPVGTSTVDENPLHRKPAPLDINGDGKVSPVDALLIINVLNNFRGLPTNDPVRAFFTIGQVKADSSGDRGVTPLDALLVINALNRRSTLGGAGEGEGEASVGVEQYQAAADDFFAQLGDNSDLELLKKRRS